MTTLTAIVIATLITATIIFVLCVVRRILDTLSICERLLTNQCKWRVLESDRNGMSKMIDGNEVKIQQWQCEHCNKQNNFYKKVSINLDTQTTTQRCPHCYKFTTINIRRIDGFDDYLSGE